MQRARIYKSRGKYGARQQHLNQMKVRGGVLIPWIQLSAGGLLPRMVSSLDREEQNTEIRVSVMKNIYMSTELDDIRQNIEMFWVHICLKKSMQMSSFPEAMTAIQASCLLSLPSAALNLTKQSLNLSNLCKWLTTSQRCRPVG